jgi:dTDP-3-amino-2,3,6-trideoxy-4-keto-D-glucose/dTDP-3-amino-3,4,6-trideoxy-alpha-D-glucose/dTDP-2,6-dideoxy-D-kanosamine transaminase
VKRLAESIDPVPLNDLSRSWIATASDVHAGLLRVLTSGWYVHGPEHQAFEAELAAFLGVGHAVGVASGTDALELALAAVGCAEGSEVVTAANAGGYTSIAAARLGCRVAYADVEAESLVMSGGTVAAAIGPSTRAVVVTHLYGNVADVEGIAAVCRPRGIAIVEDCAQSLGAVLDGRRVGAVGDAAAISFYPTKNLGAAGDGGAVATRHDDVAASVRSLRQYGWGPKYRIERTGGMNSRLDEIQASILRCGLRRLDDMTADRQAIVRRYREVLDPSPARMVSGATTSFVAHLAVARFAARDRARELFHAAGVATDIHYPVPDHRQAALPAPIRTTSLPETERAAEEVLSIPCFPEMTESEIDRVCEALKRAAVA